MVISALSVQIVITEAAKARTSQRCRLLFNGRPDWTGKWSDGLTGVWTVCIRGS